MAYFCLQCHLAFPSNTRRVRIKTPQSKFLGFVHDYCYEKYSGKILSRPKPNPKYLIKIDPKIFELGYSKHVSKKGLFVKKCITGVAYLDYRNKGLLPREEQVELGPMHYYFDKPMTWKSRRIRNTQMKILEENQIKFRLSFYAQYTDKIQELAMGEGDGYCKFCKKDFQDESLFCSSECNRLFGQQDVLTCEACKGLLDPNDEILHHVEYSPEEIIVSVHKRCHVEIHRSWEHPELRPPQDAIDDFYKKSN